MKRIFKYIFGTKNDKELKKFKKILHKINKMEEQYKKLSDEELKNKFKEYKNIIRKELEKENLLDLNFLNIKEDNKQTIKNNINKIIDKYIVNIYAITRETSKRILGMRHHDVQIIGGLVLNDGKIAEMKTGEGKTLVATLPVILNAIINKVYVITVNDYLAQRDAKIMTPLYEFFDFKVGIIKENQSPQEKVENYKNSDIIYCTNTEFGFDYLRNNIANSIEEQPQSPVYYYAIIDEADSILIDEARSPLIISGPANKNLDVYEKADKNAKELIINEDFTVNKKEHLVLLTEKGIEKVEKYWKIDNLYDLENAHLAHHIEQALSANYLFEKDVDYIVMHNHDNNTDTIQIIDEFTGRISEGRKFSEGLHQALEAKEGVPVTEENETYASITYQMLFQNFIKLSGMTGTAQTDATELDKIYKLETISIPTNKPVLRKDLEDRFFFNKNTKYKQIINKVKELQKKGQPVLIGTISIEESEYLSKLFNENNIKHRVLNAKNHKQEAEIIEEAGQKNKVTIATNMAGRGVDIKLGEGVNELGGLYIIGASRNENRRIDDQLRGRSGRQGDKGTSQFYVSLEDELIKLFADEKLIKKLKFLGIKEDDEIESSFTSKIIKSSQSKINNLKFESRKNVYDYDKVLNIQRKNIYMLRQQILEKKLDIEEIYSGYLDVYSDYLYDKILDLAIELENFNLYNESIDKLNNFDNGTVNLQIQKYINFIKQTDFSSEFKELIIKRENEEKVNVVAKKLDIYSIIQYVYFQNFNESFLEYDFIKNSFNNTDIDENSKNEIKDFIKNMVSNMLFESIKENITEEQKKEFMFTILLRTLDRLWREHIDKLEILRTGIGLRGYNQKDPLTEYKKESYELFQEFFYNIKIEFIKDLKNYFLDIVLGNDEDFYNEISPEEMNEEMVNWENGNIIPEELTEEELQSLLELLPPEALEEFNKTFFNQNMEESIDFMNKEMKIDNDLIGKNINDILK